MLTNPSSRRCVPIRLCDIPENVRMIAARKVCQREGDPEARLAIIAAAVWPSERVYFIAPHNEVAA